MQDVLAGPRMEAVDVLEGSEARGKASAGERGAAGEDDRAIPLWVLPGVQLRWMEVEPLYSRERINDAWRPLCEDDLLQCTTCGGLVSPDHVMVDKQYIAEGEIECVHCRWTGRGE